MNNCKKCTNIKECGKKDVVEYGMAGEIKLDAKMLGLNEVTTRDLIEKLTGTILDQCIYYHEGRS